MDIRDEYQGWISGMDIRDEYQGYIPGIHTRDRYQGTGMDIKNGYQ